MFSVVPGNPKRHRDTADHGRDRQHDRERQPEGLEIRRQQQENHQNSDDQAELQPAEHLPHRHDLAAKRSR